MKSRLIAVIVALVALALLGGAVVGGYYWGHTEGKGQGYRIGILRGRVDAARKGPPAVRNKGWTVTELATTPAWRDLGELAEGEATPLADLLNRAPSPCYELSRRGVSLGSSLLDPDTLCDTAGEQTRLALAVIRTFPDDADEALAALRVERRARPDTAGRPVRGNPDAEVFVVEWGDFQCPYCTRIQPLAHKLLEEEPDIGLVFKHFPLSFHKAAMPAALAAEAAAEQGSFWEMHDALFAMGKDLADEVDPGSPVPQEGPVPFEGVAEELGLDVTRFRADYRSEAVQERVSADLREARSLGVGGTPTLFVDARQVTERLSVEMLQRLIDRAEGERQWRFSWDLPPAPKGEEETEPAEEEAG